MITTALQGAATLGPPSSFSGRSFLVPLVCLMLLAVVVALAVIALDVRAASSSRRPAQPPRRWARPASHARPSGANSGAHGRIVRAAARPRPSTPKPTPVRLDKKL